MGAEEVVHDAEMGREVHRAVEGEAAAVAEGGAVLEMMELRVEERGRPRRA